MLAIVTAEELDLLVRRFRARTLPHAEWTHAAHLAVGAWYVHHLGPEEALARLRPEIRALNDAQGTPNSDTRGYHEMITRAYVHLIAATLAERPDGTLAERVTALLAGPLGNREVLATHYSKERLMSVEARRGWVDPDRAPLPRRSGAG